MTLTRSAASIVTWTLGSGASLNCSGSGRPKEAKVTVPALAVPATTATVNLRRVEVNTGNCVGPENPRFRPDDTWADSSTRLAGVAVAKSSKLPDSASSRVRLSTLARNRAPASSTETSTRGPDATLP